MNRRAYGNPHALQALNISSNNIISRNY